MCGVIFKIINGDEVCVQVLKEKEDVCAMYSKIIIIIKKQRCNISKAIFKTSINHTENPIH